MRVSAPEPFDSGRHVVDEFASGQPRLDSWLRAYAGQSQRRDAARTFVVADDQARVVGYYTLVAAQAEHSAATAAARKGLSKHFPIPVVLLARLAVTKDCQGRGLGAALLADAMRRTVRAADEVGIRAVLVDAIDEPAAAFYQRFGFAPLADSPPP